MALGDGGYFDYLKEFGFGDRTDIDLPGEMGGCSRTAPMGEALCGVHLNGTGNRGDSASNGICVSAIANGGVLMKPFVVSEIRDAKGTCETNPATS